MLERSESVQQKCSDRELEAVKKVLSKFRPQWNNVNRDYKMRQERWEKAMSVWKQFHCDHKDLTSWLTKAETTLQDTRLVSGEIDVDAAKREQKVRAFI